ncbi:hypothetical protein, partial [Pseudomonas aeruginosa]|uniref:hypothetical protein n=1 Tax=Pseudomonas aeruginosa TaxID=287 RepID=UPI001A9F6E76
PDTRAIVLHFGSFGMSCQSRSQLFDISFSFVIVQRATHVFPHRCGEDADVACELVELIQSDGHDLITLADGNGVLRRTKLQGVVSQRSRLHNSPVT